MDDRDKRFQLGFWANRFLAVGRRLWIVEHLPDRPVVELILLARFLDAHDVHENIKTDVGPFVHVLQHSFPHDLSQYLNYVADASNSNIAYKS